MLHLESEKKILIWEFRVGKNTSGNQQQLPKAAATFSVDWQQKLKNMSTS